MRRLTLLAPILGWAGLALALGHVQSCSPYPTAITVGAPAATGTGFISDTNLRVLIYNMHFRDGDVVFLDNSTFQLDAAFQGICTLSVQRFSDTNVTVTTVCDQGVLLPGDQAAHILFRYGYEAIRAGGDDQFIMTCSTDPSTTCDLYTTTVQLTR